jgi:hypothetical protein
MAKARSGVRTPAKAPGATQPCSRAERVRGGLTRRRLFQYAAIALVLCAEWLVASVPTVDESTFDKRVTELERTQAWRYGYLLQRHGAVLVKTRLVAGAPLLAPIDADDEIAPIMARELRMKPWKATFEIGFYASLWAFWSGALPRLRQRFSGEDSTRWRRSAALGMSWAAMITAVLAPFLIAGYGEPLFSNWQGPGALSTTTWGFGSTGTAWGPSLTYRVVLQAVIMFPLLSVAWTFGFLEPVGARAAFWFVSVLLYAFAATALKWISEGPDGRRASPGGR